MKRYAVIMAGGAGERFWPVSRIRKPKHLWAVAGEGECLLGQTISRVEKTVDKKNILIVTNSEQVSAIKKVCPDFPVSNIISEPCGRDTSAAIALAATLVGQMSGSVDSSFAVFPSDHTVDDPDMFAKTLSAAFGVAEAGDRLVTIGVNPQYPATGFGYIQRGKPCGENCFKVSRFYEKPSLARAAAYCESGDFYWNAGIFVWKTSSILAAVRRYIPETAETFSDIGRRLKKGGKLDAVLSEVYPSVEKISIDFAVLERCDNAYVIPAQFAWDDVGSWSAIERHYPKNGDGIVAKGEVFFKDSKDCVVFDVAGRATALVGVKNLVVVHSDDATLVCSRDCAENLKALVRELPKKYR